MPVLNNQPIPPADEQVPDGQTPLNDKLGHRYLDVFSEGIKARDDGTGSPYHGHSLEHCLHAAGWVQRDLRLALDAARSAPETTASDDVVEAGPWRDYMSGAALSFEPGCLNIKRNGSGSFAFRDDILDDEWDDESGAHYKVANFPAGEAQAIRDYLNTWFPVANLPKPTEQATSPVPDDVVEPWGYGWFELGGTKRASGYLPTINYPRSEDISEGPFPLYRANLPKPTEQATSPAPDAVLRELLQEASVLLFDSLYHLRLDEGAQIYDGKAKSLKSRIDAALTSPASTAEGEGE